MQAQDHVNKNLNYLFIQITTTFTCKSKRKLELLIIYALKKKSKQKKKKVKAMQRCKIQADLSYFRYFFLQAVTEINQMNKNISIQLYDFCLYLDFYHQFRN